MKLKSILSTGLFATVAALSMGAQAASDMDKAAEAKAPATGMQADQKMKPHSHVEEKTGVAPNALEAKSDKVKADKDKSKHYHPRDGKS